MIEKRNNVRITPDKLVNFIIIDKLEEYSPELENISEAGFSMTYHLGYKVNDIIDVDIYINDNRLSVQGRVIYSIEDMLGQELCYRTGVKFLILKRPEQLKLIKLLG